MSPLFLYFLKASLFLIVFYAFYRLVLKNETWYRFNRFYLLATMALSVLLPVISLPATGIPLPAVTFQLGEVNVSSSGQVVPQPVQLSIEEVVMWFYIAIVMVFIFRLLYNVFRLIRIRRMSGRLTEATLNVFVNPDVPSSFSFFTWIFLDTKQTDDIRKNVILSHELAHIRQLHSLDLLIAEVFKAFFWFHPFSWLYHNSLQEVHEYLADREVLRAGTRAAEYMGVLMQQIDLSHPLPISNHFNQSLLKRRFTMITKSKSGRLKAFRAGFLMPVLFLSCIFILNSVQNTTLAQDSKKNTKTTQKEVATPVEKTKTTTKFVAPVVKPESNSDEVFEVVEDMPQYADGQDAMLKYIGQNVNYPEKAKKLGVEAAIYVNFVVDKSGNLTKAKVLKAKGVPLKEDAKKVSDADYQAALDEMSKEAVRVVNSLPGKWKPGKQGGKAVNVAFTLPIRFNLN